MAENADLATYTQYEFERGVWEDPGVRMLPVAGPAPQYAGFVVLHAPISYTWIAWAAVRIGAPCVMPDPYQFEESDENLVYLGGQISSMIPHPTGTGEHCFVQSGVAWYGNAANPTLVNVLQTGRMPWEQTGVGDNDIPISFFDNSNLSIGLQQSPNPLPQPLQSPLQDVPQNIIRVP